MGVLDVLGGLFGGDKPEPEKPGANEIEQGRQAMDKWQRYQNEYVPIENQFMARALESNLPAKQQAFVDRSVNATRQQLQMPTLQPGMPPNSAQFIRANNMAGGTMGRGLALSKVGGQQAAADNYSNLIDQLVRIGRGKSAQAKSSLSQASALESANNAANTAYANAENQSRMEMVGNIAGMAGYAGGSKAGWWGPNSNNAAKPMSQNLKNMNAYEDTTGYYGRVS